MLRLDQALSPKNGDGLAQRGQAQRPELVPEAVEERGLRGQSVARFVLPGLDLAAQCISDALIFGCLRT
jgi:hypothetical protein